MDFGDELRLLWFLLLNATAFYAAWRIASRFGTGSLSQTLLDTLLFNCTIQYTIVCGLGAVGCLSPTAITIASSTIAMLAFWFTRHRKTGVSVAGLTPEGRVALAVLTFGGGYLLAYCIEHRYVPVLETDALAYHLPAAVGWLQTGRLALFGSWYWNPANTYSPIAAEAFMVWLLAPMRSDVFVRYVQSPALVMVGLAMYRIGRQVQARPTVAACVAVAAMLSRSIFVEATLVKDDLWVTAFFIAAVSFLMETRSDRLSPWRIGSAVGLLLATKYPALLTLPLLLLAIRSPRRFVSRDGMIVSCIIALLAGPWYLRNWIVYGNPLQPMILKLGRWTVFGGLFNVTRDASTRTPAAIWHMVSDAYFGTSPTLLATLGAMWLFAVIRSIIARNSGDVRQSNWLPLLGPVLGPIVFTVFSPHPEIRYFFPFLLPLFAAAAVALCELTAWPFLQIGFAIALTMWSTATSFNSGFSDFVLQFSIEGILIAAIAWCLVRFWSAHRRLIAYLMAMGTLGFTLLTYVNWQSFSLFARDSVNIVWPERYGEIGQVWLFARDELPANTTIAYANTYLVYPLLGSRYEHRVVYAPVRPGEKSFDDLPSLGDRVPQNRIVETVTDAMNRGADEGTWLANLNRLRVDYVFVANHERSDDPPELRFIRRHPELFRQISPGNPAAAIYRFNRSE